MKNHQTSFCEGFNLAMAPHSHLEDHNAPLPKTHASPQDRREIEGLLAAYTRVVSTKDEALFENLLLNKEIPFTYVSEDGAKVARGGIANYEAFRKGGF